MRLRIQTVISGAEIRTVRSLYRFVLRAVSLDLSIAMLSRDNTMVLGTSLFLRERTNSRVYVSNTAVNGPITNRALVDLRVCSTKRAKIQKTSFEVWSQSLMSLRIMTSRYLRCLTLHFSSIHELFDHVHNVNDQPQENIFFFVPGRTFRPPDPT